MLFYDLFVGCLLGIDLVLIFIGSLLFEFGLFGLYLCCLIIVLFGDLLGFVDFALFTVLLDVLLFVFAVLVVFAGFKCY